MAALFDAIARSHHVSSEQVRQAVWHRRVWLDAAVILTFAALYGVASIGVVRRIFRSGLGDERWVVLPAVVAASAVVSFAGVLLGGVWSGLIEVLRVGNGHLSYRGNRIPWGQHTLATFVGPGRVLADRGTRLPGAHSRTHRTRGSWPRRLPASPWRADARVGRKAARRPVRDNWRHEFLSSPSFLYNAPGSL